MLRSDSVHNFTGFVLGAATRAIKKLDLSVFLTHDAHHH